MTNQVQGFPQVPAKERTHARLSVLKVGQMADAVQATSVTPGATTGIQLGLGEAPANLADGDLVLIYGSLSANLDGIHEVTAIVSDLVTVDVDTTNETIDSAWLMPYRDMTDGGVAEFEAVGNADDYSGNVTFSTDDWSTIGTLGSTEPNEVTFPVNLTLFSDKTLEQVAGLLGFLPPTPGAPVNQAIRLDPDGGSNVSIVIEQYDGRTTLSKLQNYVVHINIQWNDWGFTQSSGNYKQWTLTGAADDTFARAAAQS